MNVCSQTAKFDDYIEDVVTSFQPITSFEAHKLPEYLKEPNFISKDQSEVIIKNNMINEAEKTAQFDIIESITLESRLSKNIQSILDLKNLKFQNSQSRSSIKDSRSSKSGYFTRSQSLNSKEIKRTEKFDKIYKNFRAKQNIINVEGVEIVESNRSCGKIVVLDERENDTKAEKSFLSKSRLSELMKDVKSSNKQAHKAIYTIMKSKRPQSNSRDFLDENSPLLEFESRVLNENNPNILNFGEKMKGIRKSYFNNKTEHCVTCGCSCKPAKNNSFKTKELY